MAKELQKLWEWCGFKFRGKCTDPDVWEYGVDLYEYPNQKEEKIYNYDRPMPEPDLNNLFKYAVPKFGGNINIEFYPRNGKYCCSLTRTKSDEDKTILDSRIEGQDSYAQALFKAIQEVINGK
ncbi:MAG: hypothetical protein WC455_26775 [Dehalococcoidia bacterium]|jgi:hypothetical protein